jgi:hypothetical protein
MPEQQKLILGQIVESDRTDLEDLDTIKIELGNDNSRIDAERTLNN